MNDFPTIRKAMSMVAEEHGLDDLSQTIDLTKLDNADNLPEIEKALAELSDTDLEGFAIGDEDEIDEIAGRSPVLEKASRLLDSFFSKLEG